MTFRPATYTDAAQLLEWRHQDENKPWYATDETDVLDHVRWLTLMLQSPAVQLLIWETNGTPTGMVRIDSNGELAFHGDDPNMLAAALHLASQYGGRLKVTTDADDPKANQLLAAGFTEYPCRALIYRP